MLLEQVSRYIYSCAGLGFTDNIQAVKTYQVKENLLNIHYLVS